MHHWRSQAGIGLSAALLASLLATSTVATTLAYSTSNANPSRIVHLSTPTSVPISYVWNGTGPSDAMGPLGTTFAVTLPPGYYWSALPGFTPSPAGTITFSGPVASNAGLTQTWTMTAFSPTTAWSLSLTGGIVVATQAAGVGPITLKLGTAPPVQIASLISSVSAGTAVPLTVSPIAVPADGASLITLTFGAPTVSCTNAASFTVATTAGTFATTNLPGVTTPVNGNSATVLCGNFGSVTGKTLTLRAPATAGTATVTVTLAGAAVADSSSTVTFTPVSVSPSSVTIGGKGHGAAKVALYSVSTTPTASGCAPTAATASVGATTYGFAVMTATGNGRLNLEVSLKGVPAGVYTVAVYQAAGASCTHSSIRINPRGNGNRHFRLALAGTTQVWVTASSAAGVFVTPAVMVTAKAHGPKDKTNNGKGNKGNDQGENEDND